MSDSEPQNTTTTGTLFGIPLDILKTGGTVLILLAILGYVFQQSGSKDQAYIQLATSIAAQTTQISTLSGKVDDLSTIVTNMRIQFARAGLDVTSPTLPNQNSGQGSATGQQPRTSP